MSFFGSSRSLIGIIHSRHEQLEDSSVNTTYAITMYDERNFSAPALVNRKTNGQLEINITGYEMARD